MKSKICFKCNVEQPIDEFYVHKEMKDGHINKCKTCSRKEVRIGTIPRRCNECKKEFMARASEINRGGGKVCSRKCFYPYFKRTVKRDKNSPNWKGDSVGRLALHDWVRRNLGRPDTCEFCGTKEGKLEWSNISQTYKRELSDWQRLCKKCHVAYDDTPNKRKASIMKRFGTLDIVPRNTNGRFRSGSLIKKADIPPEFR